jgi:hypothetical protein
MRGEGKGVRIERHSLEQEENRRDILDQKRAEYGEQIVSTLSTQLMPA